MSLDALPDRSPAEGTVDTAEVVVHDDVLVKAFYLGPGAELEPHEHPDATNVFHVVRGTVTVVSGEETAAVAAPGVVEHEPGVVHGARNETDSTAVFTAALCPMPG